MTPYYADPTVTVYAGDCLDVLRELPDASVDAVVTDPPYGLEFMGKEWDRLGDVGKTSHAGIAEEPGFKGFRLPAYNGSANSKCANCEKWKWDHEGRKCECDAPAFANVKAHQARLMQDWHAAWAAECLRVLKPGGHLLAFGGTRTSHRLACAVEDAGFEIRDSIAWLYGSGFPKSLDVSKAIDKARTEDRAPVDAVRVWLNERRTSAGYSHDAVNKHFGHASNGGGSSSAWMTNPTSKSLPTWDQWLELKRFFGFGDDMDAEAWRLNGRKGKPGDNFEAREVLTTRTVADIRNGHGRELGGAMFAGEETGTIEHKTTAPATPDAERWQGWGTALKPAHEPIVVARKPLVGTVAANVLAHGTGALNVDGCRIEHDEPEGRPSTGMHGRRAGIMGETIERHRETTAANTAGRWPANVVLDESQAAALDQQSGELHSAGPTQAGGDARNGESSVFGIGNATASQIRLGDTGGASRFFLIAREDEPCGDALTKDASTSVGKRPADRSGSSLTDGSGSKSTDSSPTVTRSTTRTTTHSTTTSPTSCALPQSGTTTTTSDSARTTETSTGSNAVDASDAGTTSPSTPTVAAKPAPTTDIAKTASATTSESGAQPTASTPTPTCVPIDGLDARFRYTAKADAGERVRVNGIAHPTVKPLSLMRWLVRLVCPPGGTILEPFAGSGTTVEACILEGFRCIAVEREADYLPLIVQRINRRRDPVAAVLSSGDDGGLFDLLDGGAA